MKKIILRNEPDTKALAKQCAIHSVVCCAECKEQELIEEMQREQHLHDLQWHENMNSLYTWDEGGFCDGFTK